MLLRSGKEYNPLDLNKNKRVRKNENNNEIENIIIDCRHRQHYEYNTSLYDCYLTFGITLVCYIIICSELYPY